MPLPGSGPGETVTLRAVPSTATFADATDIAVHGQPYASEAEAAEAAARWRGITQKAFASANLPADFGDRAPRGGVTEFGLKALEADLGQRVVNDRLGTTIYECEPEPRFVMVGTPVATVGRNVERLIQGFDVAGELDVRMSERDQLAYDLYSASFSETSADARFVMLMMAVETMIDPVPRADHVQDHVRTLMADTKASDLPPHEVKSILGSLNWLLAESINQAGRRLARTVGDREYGGQQAERFFSSCYELRSALVHGGDPRPDRAVVDGMAAHLEQFVADLLSIELLDR